MPQSPSAGYKAAAVATVSEPHFRLRVDWDSDGWAAQNLWTDESTYLLGFNLDRKAGEAAQMGIAVVGNSVAGTGTITLRNDDGRFSPHLGGNVLATGGYVGIPFDLAVGYEVSGADEWLVQFSGYIMRPTVPVTTAKVTLQVQDRAYDLLNWRGSSALYVGTSVPTYIAAVIAKLPAAKQPTTTLDPGMFPITAWLDEESLWEELAWVALSQVGHVLFTKAGALSFCDGTYFARTITSSYTFTAGKELTQTWEPQALYNHVEVFFSGALLTLPTELWQQRVNDLSPLLAGESVTVNARFRCPHGGLITPTAYAKPTTTDDKEVEYDYAAQTHSGANATSSLGVSVTNIYAQSADVTVTNNHATAILYVSKLRLRGLALNMEHQEKAEASDATTINNWKRTLTVRNDNYYIQSRAQAQAIADLLLVRHKAPRARYQFQPWPPIAWLGLLDRITITEAAYTGINEDFFIIGMNQSFAAGSGYRQSYDLIRAVDIIPAGYTWFIPGTTALGAAGGSYFH